MEFIPISFDTKMNNKRIMMSINNPESYSQQKNNGKNDIKIINTYIVSLFFCQNMILDY
jgi:hypothetical protein